MWEIVCGQMLQGFYSSDLIVEELSAQSYINSLMSEEFRCNVKPPSSTREKYSSIQGSEPLRAVRLVDTSDEIQ